VLIEVCLVTDSSDEYMSPAQIPDLRLVELDFRNQVRKDFPRQCRTARAPEDLSHTHPQLIGPGNALYCTGIARLRVHAGWSYIASKQGMW
jgi:hypothetical protein